MLHMARTSLRDGREHGCAGGRFISGSGNAAGMALAETMLGFRQFCCTLRPKVLYRHDWGVLGLPGQVAALYLPEADDRRLVRLYNAGRAGVTLDVCAEDTRDRKVVSATVDGAPHAAVKGNRVSVALAPGREIRVAMALG
jgi:hypothetical protein